MWGCWVYHNGDNVLMASKIYISDHNHGSYDELISDHPYTDKQKKQYVSQ
jgi:hypothetical protein